MNLKNTLNKMIAQKQKNQGLQKPKLQEAIIEIREGITYQQILAEQNYESMSYKEFRTLANKIEWEHSLEELLAILD